MSIQNYRIFFITMHNQNSSTKIDNKNFLHVHAQQVNSHISKIIATKKNFHDQTSHTQQNFSIAKISCPLKINPCPQKFSIPTNLPTKFYHVHEIKFTHNNKISHMHHEHIHTSPQHKFFIMPILPKSKSKLIQQHHNLPTLSKFHKPPTLSKFTPWQKKKKIQHFKNAPKPTLQHDQSYNAPNSNNHTTKWQWLTIKLSMKHETIFVQAKKPKKNSPWYPCENMEHGFGVLKEPLLIMPIKC